MAMPTNNGNYKDNRYCPGLESSSRRVREDEFDRTAPKPVWSNELAFVPARRKAPAPHDPQTLARIREHKQLETFPHGQKLIGLVENWNWIDRMQGTREKQEHLEKMIRAARRDRGANEHILTFLLIALEPARRSVSKQFMELRSGLDSPSSDEPASWLQRGEARLVEHLDREALYDVTRYATLEAIYRYPADCRALFAWFRETIAHRALDHLRSELSQHEHRGIAAVEADALQGALAGLQDQDAPPRNELSDFARWAEGLDVREIYGTVGEFNRRDGSLRRACNNAIRRLPRLQQHTINALFFDGVPVDELSRLRAVAPSTIYNTNSHAKRNLSRDDLFFTALHGLGHVRDQARAEELQRLYPDGLTPKGQRVVTIPRAA